MLLKGRFKISEFPSETTDKSESMIYVKRTKIGRFVETTSVNSNSDFHFGRFKLSNLLNEEIKDETPVSNENINSEIEAQEIIGSVNDYFNPIQPKSSTSSDKLNVSSTRLGIYDKNNDKSSFTFVHGKDGKGANNSSTRLSIVKNSLNNLCLSDSFKLEKETDREKESDFESKNNINNSDSLILCLSPQNNNSSQLMDFLKKCNLRNQISNLVRLMKHKKVITFGNQIKKLLNKSKYTLEQNMSHKVNFFKKLKSIVPHKLVNIVIFNEKISFKRDKAIESISTLYDKSENKENLLDQRYDNALNNIMRELKNSRFTDTDREIDSNNTLISQYDLSTFKIGKHKNTSLSFTSKEIESKEDKLENNDKNTLIDDIRSDSLIKNVINNDNSDLRIKINTKHRKILKEDKSLLQDNTLKNTAENTSSTNDLINVSMSKIDINDQIESPKFGVIENSPFYSIMKLQNYNFEQLALESSKDYNNNAHNTSNITLHTIDFNDGSYFSDFLNKKESRNDNIAKENIIFNWNNGGLPSTNTNLHLQNGGVGSSLTLGQTSEKVNLIQNINSFELAADSYRKSEEKILLLEKNSTNFEFLSNKGNQIEKPNSVNSSLNTITSRENKLIVILYKLLISKYIKNTSFLADLMSSIQDKINYGVYFIIKLLKNAIHYIFLRIPYDKMLDDSGIS